MYTFLPPGLNSETYGAKVYGLPVETSMHMRISLAPQPFAEVKTEDAIRHNARARHGGGRQDCSPLFQVGPRRAPFAQHDIVEPDSADHVAFELLAVEAAGTEPQRQFPYGPRGNEVLADEFPVVGADAGDAVAILLVGAPCSRRNPAAAASRPSRPWP